jgi:hypothetical protein
MVSEPGDDPVPAGGSSHVGYVFDAGESEQSAQVCRHPGVGEFLMYALRNIEARYASVMLDTDCVRPNT